MTEETAASHKGQRIVRVLHSIALLCSLAAVATGALVAAAWFLNIHALLAGAIVMKTNAAVGILLAGTSLFLLLPERPGPWRRWAARACAAVVLLLGAVTLVEHVSGWDLHVDQLLAREAPGASATTSPNRMGPPAALSLVLLGAALLSLSRREGRRLWQPLAVVVGLLALLPTLGYLYEARELYGLARLTGIAWPTALTSLTLSVGLLCARPREGMTALLTSPGPGGVMIRRLLVPSVLLPLVMGWLRLLGERRGLYDPALGTAIVMLTIILAFTTLVWLSGRRLDEAADVLRRQQELLSVTLASIGDGVIVTDLQGRVTFANEEAEHLTGWGRAEAEGQALHSVFHVVEEGTWQAIGDPADPSRHALLISRDGREIPVEHSTAPVKGPEGTARGVVWVFRDVSDKWRHEKALGESEEQFRTMADAIPQLAFIAAADGGVYWYNRRWYEYTGTTLAQAEGWGWQSVLEPSAAPEAIERWRASIVTGEPMDVEVSLRGADGGFRWFLTRVVPLKGSDERVVRWFGTCTDISESRAVSEALVAAKTVAEAARAEAEEAGRAKDEFLAVLSHELRTPLTPVLASVSMLQHDPRLPRDVQERLEIVRRNVELEARLIDDLLDVTRIARGKVELHKQPVELCEVIRRAVEVCMPDVEARELDFSVEMGPDAPYVIDADPARLQQAFWNVIKNAVKFTPAGGRIQVRCRKVGPFQVTTEVNDNGLGISPRLMPHLFKPFERESEGRSTQFGGLGLGLTITKAMLEMHGGTIRAASEGPGKGTTFSITLPMVPSLPPRRQAEAVRRPETRSRSLRILLVEDHGDTADMMKLVLEGQGHEVSGAADMASALSAAAEPGGFDLLISDLGLPDGSGLDLMRALRDGGRMLPGIALSGYGREQDIAASRAAGFAAHLTKPVNVEQLEDAIRAVVDYPRAV